MAGVARSNQMNFPGDEIPVGGLLSGGNRGGCWAVTVIATEISRQTQAKDLIEEFIDHYVKPISRG